MSGKIHPYFILCTLLIMYVLTSCIKEDISNLNNNVLMNQSFAVPYGPVDLKIDAPPLTDTSSIPGRYGSFYYNGNKYPNNFLYFPVTYGFNFNLKNKQAKEEWIKRLVFHLFGVNSFPTRMYLQVYIYGGNNLQGDVALLDSVFTGGPVFLEPAVVNAQGDIEQSTSALVDIPFEGARLDMIKQADSLVCQGEVLSTNTNNSAIRLNENSKFHVNIAVQVELQYNLKDAIK